MVRWFYVQIVFFGFTSAFPYRLMLAKSRSEINPTFAAVRSILKPRHNDFLSLRGGEQQNLGRDDEIDVVETDVAQENIGPATTLQTVATPGSTSAVTSILPMAFSNQLGQLYAKYLQSHPIHTKSLTACCVFALSDIMAQRLEKSNYAPSSEKQRPKPLQWSRILASAMVGLLYFGPAAHFWYEWIFKILPSTSLVSTLQKAALGQLIFGPSFTCIFFATSLLQSGTFSLSRWWDKIRSDLPGAWLAGAGFWPLVDLISYSFIAPQWIPLFVNLCSLVWTTYLVLKSYAKK